MDMQAASASVRPPPLDRLAALTSARHKALAEMTAYARELAIERAQLAQRDPAGRLN
jgi:hypothetical protein